jgi:tripartite-type tricarboxylate transporter receptor subunit TctC
MKYRRHFLRNTLNACAAATAAIIAPQVFAASSAKPIRIVVGFAPGGTADTLARLIAAKAAMRLNRPVLVDNKPGAAAILGADHVARSAADGHTFFLTFSEALVSNTALYRNLPYKPERDFDFVALLAAGPLVICVNKDVPANNLASLVANARKGGVLNFGSWGKGSHGHLLCEALNKFYQIDMQHIAYKGEAPTIVDLVAGQIQLAAGSIGGMAQHIKSGALKPIGVIGHHESAALPMVPTLLSQGANDAAFTTLGWVGLVAPKGITSQVATEWSALMRDIMSMPDVAARFSSIGFEPRYLDGAAFFKQWQRDTPVWTRLINAAGLSLD